MDPQTLANIATVAEVLRGVGLEDAVFVGGATIGLLLTDPAAPEARGTVDVDVVTPVPNRSAYHRLEDRLRAAGHTQDLGESVCRWLIKGVNVDLMPPDENILGFSNRWYPALIAHATDYLLPSGETVKLVSGPYLVATKLEAFRSRGGGDYAGSRDLEDIIVLLDGREEVVDEVAAASMDVRRFIRDAFGTFLADRAFLEAVAGHLLPDDASQARAPLIMGRMAEIAGLSE